MPLTESLKYSQNHQGKLIFFLEHREVRYPVGPFGFLERGDLSTVSSSLLSPLPPISAFSVMSDGKFLADLIVVVLSIEVGDLALLKF